MADVTPGDKYSFEVVNPFVVIGISFVVNWFGVVNWFVVDKSLFAVIIPPEDADENYEYLVFFLVKFLLRIMISQFLEIQIFLYLRSIYKLYFMSNTLF